MGWNIREKTENDIKCDYCSGGLRDYVIADNGHVYCEKLCAKEHETKLLRSGELTLEIPEVKLEKKFSRYTDDAGQTIDFKEPYFDTAFRRTFKSKEEKYRFMKEHRFVNTGDSFDKYKKQWKEHEEQKRSKK